MIDGLFHGIGYVAERLSALANNAGERVTRTAGAAREAGEQIRDQAAEFEEHLGETEAFHDAAGLLGTTAAGWFATRLLQPREVNWPRAIAAGMVGTLLFDTAKAVDQRLTGRTLDSSKAIAAAMVDGEAAEEAMGIVGRYAAGLGLAALFARYLYGRLPGPPAVQGALFGVLDAVTLSWGGVLPLLHRISPDVQLPLGYAGLTRSPELTAQTLLRHVAYGVGVGVVYRNGGIAD